jgi:hypothetical protein
MGSLLRLRLQESPWRILLDNARKDLKLNILMIDMGEPGQGCAHSLRRVSSPYSASVFTFQNLKIE